MGSFLKLHRFFWGPKHRLPQPPTNVTVHDFLHHCVHDFSTRKSIFNTVSLHLKASLLVLGFSATLSSFLEWVSTGHSGDLPTGYAAMMVATLIGQLVYVAIAALIISTMLHLQTQVGDIHSFRTSAALIHQPLENVTVGLGVAVSLIICDLLVGTLGIFWLAVDFRFLPAEDSTFGERFDSSFFPLLVHLGINQISSSKLRPRFPPRQCDD